MRTREIAALGKRASVISMGSTYFGSAMPDEEVFEVLDAFCALGGSGILAYVIAAIVIPHKPRY